MPRIRTIKPELWQDEKLAALDPLTRLVFVGLISMADDAGRLVDNVKSIDGFIFPETEDTAKDALGILARLARILRYEASSGQRVIQIVNWQRHQRVDHPNKYVLPAPPTEAIEAVKVAPVSLETRENGARVTGKPLATTSTPTSTSTNDPDHTTTSADAAPVLRPHDLSSCLGLVVEKLYFGNRPPKPVMRTEASIAKQLGEHYGFDRLAQAIEGLSLLRERGELSGVSSRQAVGLRWLNSEKFNLNQFAVAEDAVFRDASPRTGRGGTAGLAEVARDVVGRIGA